MIIANRYAKQNQSVGHRLDREMRAIFAKEKQSPAIGRFTVVMEIENPAQPSPSGGIAVAAQDMARTTPLEIARQGQFAGIPALTPFTG